MLCLGAFGQSSTLTCRSSPGAAFLNYSFLHTKLIEFHPRSFTNAVDMLEEIMQDSVPKFIVGISTPHTGAGALIVIIAFSAHWQPWPRYQPNPYHFHSVVTGRRLVGGDARP